tara:strand:- start:246 stop:743 length:498 start_codon:yes stop_codon:yes gene_type:complete
METFKTIYGKANFTYLSSPDTQFGKNDYHVTLELPKEKAQEHTKAIEEIISKEVAEQHKLTPSKTTPLKRAPKPYKDLGDVVTFKLHSKFKPKVWDKNQKEIGEDVSIWKDSTMWINYKASGYNKSIGLGCTLYIQSVQIDNLVQGSAGTNGACPFPKRSEEATA